MRVCPKCGYIDEILWRYSINPYIEWIRATEFVTVYPKLLGELRHQKFVEFGPYAYHLTKNGNVERQAVFENPTYRLKWHIDFEAGYRLSKTRSISILANRAQRRNRTQTRLLEVEKHE
jgi:hypothetical protein